MPVFTRQNNKIATCSCTKKFAVMEKVTDGGYYHFKVDASGCWWPAAEDKNCRNILCKANLFTLPEGLTHVFKYFMPASSVQPAQTERSAETYSSRLMSRGMKAHNVQK